MNQRSEARRLVRRGSRDDRSPRVAALSAGLATPTLCQSCGAVYARKTWRAGARLANLPASVHWTTCPACRQVQSGEYFGRVSIHGEEAMRHVREILGRVRNVVARAGYTQPERRLVSTEEGMDFLEILTTSQKLAHRIARELQKAHGGEARYRWNPDEGSLHAIWIWRGKDGAK